MNESFPKQEIAEAIAEDAASPQQAQKPGKGLAMLALVLALASSACVAWLWWQNLRAGSAVEAELATASAHQA